MNHSMFSVSKVQNRWNNPLEYKEFNCALSQYDLSCLWDIQSKQVVHVLPQLENVLNMEFQDTSNPQIDLNVFYKTTPVKINTIFERQIENAFDPSVLTYALVAQKNHLILCNQNMT